MAISRKSICAFTCADASLGAGVAEWSLSKRLCRGSWWRLWRAFVIMNRMQRCRCAIASRLKMITCGAALWLSTDGVTEITGTHFEPRPLARLTCQGTDRRKSSLPSTIGGYTAQRNGGCAEYE